MKILIENYTFDASEKTIEFDDYSADGIDLARVLLIANAKTNLIIYNFADPTLAATVEDNVLTLNNSVVTSVMADDDPLLIFYEDPDASQNTQLTTKIAGEDLVSKVLGIILKPTSGIIYAPSLYSPITAVTKAFLKASAGNLLTFRVTNENAAKRYLQFFNRTTDPIVASSTPIMSIPIPAGTADNPGVLALGADFFTMGGDWFSTGIAFAISTTKTTFTDSATASEHTTVARYV